MLKKLVFATQNNHKLQEVIHVMKQRFNDQKIPLLKWDILSLNEIGCEEEIPETSDTLSGNALQKAMYVAEKYGVDCFADDTGLEIEALNGRPGVYSARYAGENRSFEDNMNKVLYELKGVENRKARFRTVVALILGQKQYLFEGHVNGMIIHKTTGTGGFGYDPVFQPDGFEKTFAQMTLDEKNTVSHRAMAIEKLCAFLLNYPHVD